jgi:hypothetical protein
MNDYLYKKEFLYNKTKLDLKKVIQFNPTLFSSLRNHFAYPDKESCVIAEFILSENDYELMSFVLQHR